MTGVRMFTKDGLTARKTTVVGMSVALGVGITQVADCLSGPGLPGWINSIFGSFLCSSCYNHGYFIKFDSSERRDSSRNYRRNERIK